MAVVRPQPWGEGADVTFYCDDEPDDAWEGFKQPRAKALDQFVLMRAIPACVPAVNSRVLKSDYEPWSYDLDDLLGFISFVDDVLMCVWQ